MSDFNENLFIVNRGLNTLFPQKDIFCKITNIDVRSIAYQCGKRLIKYQVCYWNNEPLIHEEAIGYTALKIDNSDVTTFSTIAKCNFLSTQELINHCIYDFNNVQLKIEKSYLKNTIINRVWDNQFQSNYENSKIYKLNYEDNSSIIIGRVLHIENHNSIKLGDNIELRSSVVEYVTYNDDLTPNEVKTINNIVYKNNDSFFIDFLLSILPTNTLMTFQMIKY